MPRSSEFGALLLMAALAAPAWSQNVVSVRPGTVEYVEGDATLQGHGSKQDLKNRMSGTLSLGAGEGLSTGSGRAEIRLTPSVVLRVGQNSRVTMISPSLVHTAFTVNSGRAEVEVDQVFDQSDLRVMVGNSPGTTETKLVKAGIYEFDADAGLLRVFEGKAEVSSPGSADAKPIDVKGGHQLALNGDARKSQGFNKKESGDDLTAWGDIRSQYTGQENAGLVQSAGGYGNGFAGGYGAYPWFADGGLYSPYGLGLFSSIYGGPFGFSGFGYPGFPYGFYGAGYGYGGFGSGLFGYGGLGYGSYGGYGGGYGYAGERVGTGYRGKSGQFANRGQGQPIRNGAPVGGIRNTQSGRSPSLAARAGVGTYHQGGGAAGGFHGASGPSSSGGGYRGSAASAAPSGGYHGAAPSAGASGGFHGGGAASSGGGGGAHR